MITGAHVLLYSTDADADRAFLHHVLGFPAVDAGGGWLIFALPPAEVAVHPLDDEAGPSAAGGTLAAELYLMCDDVRAVVAGLAGKGIECGTVSEAPWGLRTAIRLPSGGRVGLYQPTHPTALGL